MICFHSSALSGFSVLQRTMSAGFRLLQNCNIILSLYANHLLTKKSAHRLVGERPLRRIYIFFYDYIVTQITVTIVTTLIVFEKSMECLFDTILRIVSTYFSCDITPAHTRHTAVKDNLTHIAVLYALDIADDFLAL